jgi:hypothetical protein
MGRERERERKREKFEGLGVWIGIGIWFRYKSLWTVLDDFCREFGSIINLFSSLKTKAHQK